MAETADNLRFHHAKSNQAKLRTYADTADSPSARDHHDVSCIRDP
jgi:hypothetical protein